MSQTITAIYENGVLRPLTPLALPDRSEVRIRVEAAPEPPDAETHRRQVDVVLLTAGMMVPRTSPDRIQPPLSDAERDALARNIPVARPLSELILEERDGR